MYIDTERRGNENAFEKYWVLGSKYFTFGNLLHYVVGLSGWKELDD